MKKNIGCRTSILKNITINYFIHKKKDDLHVILCGSKLIYLRMRKNIKNNHFIPIQAYVERKCNHFPIDISFKFGI